MAAAGRARARAGACGVLVVTGTLSTAAGPHPGDSAEIDRFWNLLDAVYLHVRATAAFGLCFLLLLAWLVRNRERAGVLGPGAVGLLGLLLVQMASASCSGGISCRGGSC